MCMVFMICELSVSSFRIRCSRSLLDDCVRSGDAHNRTIKQSARVRRLNMMDSAGRLGYQSGGIIRVTAVLSQFLSFATFFVTAPCEQTGTSSGSRLRCDVWLTHEVNRS